MADLSVHGLFRELESRIQDLESLHLKLIQESLQKDRQLISLRSAAPPPRTLPRLPRVLVCGPNRAQVAEELRRRLGVPSAAGDARNLIEIKNKYYTALVELEEAASLSAASRPAAHRVEGEDPERVQALVVALGGATFDENLAHALTTDASGDSMDGDSSIDVRMCFESASAPDATVRAWCLSREVEHVHLRPEDPEEDEDEEVGRETFGVDRVVEALSNAMWSSMERRPAPLPSQPVAPAPKKTAAPPPQQRLNSAAPPSEKNLELQMEGMDALLHKMRELREGGARLPDAERRERASRLVAEMFQGFLGGNLEDEEEEDGNL